MNLPSDSQDKQSISNMDLTLEISKSLIDRRFSIGVAFAIGGTFLFAIKSILIKIAFADGANAISVLTLRLLFSFPFYIGMLIYLKMQADGSSERDSESNAERTTIRQATWAVCLGFLGYYLASFLDMSGLELISAQLERLTLFTYPAIVAVLAWMFLGEKITRWIVLSLVLCYCGILIMYSQERNFASGSNVTLGVLLVMGSALSFSIYVLFAKPTMQKMGSRKFTSLAMIGSTVFVVVHFLPTQEISDLNVTPRVWLIAMALAFLCTVIPSFLVNEAIVRLGATKTTIVGSTGPVFTMLLAIILLNEPTSVSNVVGMVMVLAGVACVARK